MQSFRTELENPIVEKDIIDLEQKIRAFRDGSLNPEKFRSLRLARGVYGQRQQGVQMIRIKLPFGKLSTRQLRRIAQISDQYSNANLHLTTRQDIQLHFVSLDKTPEIWALLESDQITLREACGNTVRNITASAQSGIDPNELFDVSNYAHALFEYLLRKPFCQEMGRKIKMAFSNNDSDSAFSYIHDLGFIPRIQDGVRGFKVLIGGGLGAQPFLAKTAFEFLAQDKLIPFVESVLRVFDRHGERLSRHKARLKYLIASIGLDAFLELVSAEQKALSFSHYPIQETAPLELPVPVLELGQSPNIDQPKYEKWLATNTFAQKQLGYFGVYIKIQLGNISSDKARLLAQVIDTYADSQDFRITINQGFLLRNVAAVALPFLFESLSQIELALPGFDSVADITACPGTDTCNLAIANSTHISVVLEDLIYTQYADLIYNHDIKIKISGCMNSCGQHGLAQIGFHGSSFKVEKGVVPAVQVLLGGGTLGGGEGRLSEKVIKVASKRAPAVLCYLFDDFEKNAIENEYFNSYYQRQGKDYFYKLLKPLADNTTLENHEFIDWGHDDRFATAIGVGECAGVMIDLVATLFFEADEKLDLATEAIADNKFGDSIYYTYAAFIHAAKGALIDLSVHVNTQHGVMSDFDKNFPTHNFNYKSSFKEMVLQINQNAPEPDFAKSYLIQAKEFVSQLKNNRVKQQEAKIQN